MMVRGDDIGRAINGAPCCGEPTGRFNDSLDGGR